MSEGLLYCFSCDHVCIEDCSFTFLPNQMIEEYEHYTSNYAFVTRASGFLPRFSCFSAFVELFCKIKKFYAAVFLESDLPDGDLSTG